MDSAALNTPVDSNDVEEERRKRASTMIQGAMKDLEGLQLHPSITEESSLIEGTDSSFFSDVASSVENTPSGTPSRYFEDNASIHSSSYSNNAATENSNILIAIDGMESQGTNEIMMPQRPHATEPEQKLSLLDLSPTPNQSSFNFDDHSPDPFFQNKSATIGPMKSKPQAESNNKAASLGRNVEPMKTINTTSYVSTGSLLGGLNTMLQQPTRTLNSSFALKKDDPFEIEEVDEEQLEGSVEIAEDTILNEGDAVGSDSSDDSKGTSSPQAAPKSPEADDSVFGGAEIVNLSQSESKETRKSPSKGLISCMIDTKSETLKQMKKEMAEIEKRERKKTSGAWLKGKLATGKEKMKSVKKRTKSDGQALRKAEQQKNVRKFTQPQSQLRPNNEVEVQQALPPKLPDKTAEGKIR